ncbi:hypothetical protein D9758_006784 [Tetrapyrgos nigripes]|uniref:Uncharacterized protein n=1 Tax=Tetrapyrgos nigripes TaxID=182062 RepID=A0A8H5CVI5_9AGAR|nr:hypothetical protein D9758_006784 [Tetrapyrgos nigripes]
MSELSSKRRSLKTPIHNPYDKFTQPEFDAWIGGLTGVLRKALGHVDEDDIAPTNGTYEELPVTPPAAAVEDGHMEDEELEKSMTNAGKGKTRDPREGPGLGPGTIDEPIELDSDEEDEQDEMGAEQEEYDEEYEGGDEYDDADDAGHHGWEETRENHVSRRVQEESVSEDEELIQGGEEEEAEGDYEEDEEDSLSRSYHPNVSHTQTPYDRQDDLHGEEEYDDDRDEVDYHGKYEEEYGDGEYEDDEDEGQGVEDKPIEISEDEEENDENIPPARPFEPQRHAVDLREEDDDEDVQHETLLSDFEAPHDAEMEEDAEGGSEYDELDQEPLSEQRTEQVAPKVVYELLDDDEQQPTENNTAFPLLQLEKNQPVSLRDPWEGPSQFAEDFYSGGELRQPPGTMLDPNHLSELDTSSDIGTFLTPGIITPNIASSDDLPTPDVALSRTPQHPAGDEDIEIMEIDEQGRELPVLDAKAVDSEPGSAGPDELAEASVDQEAPAVTDLTEPSTREQELRELYRGLETSHLAQPISEREPSPAPEQFQADVAEDEPSEKVSDERDLAIEDFAEEKDSEVIDVDELDDTDEVVEDKGHAVVSQPFKEVGPIATATVQPEAVPLDSTSITHTDGVIGDKGGEMTLEPVEEAQPTVTSSSELETHSSLDFPSFTRPDVDETSSVPVDATIDVAREDAVDEINESFAADVPAVEDQDQVEKTVTLDSEVVDAGRNEDKVAEVDVDDTEAVLDQQENLLVKDEDNRTQTETASESVTLTLTQEELHEEPSVDTASGDLVPIPGMANDTSRRDTVEPSTIEVQEAVVALPPSQTLMVDLKKEHVVLDAETLVESSSSSTQVLQSTLPDDDTIQERIDSESRDVRAEAKVETAVVVSAETSVTISHEQEVPEAVLPEDTNRIEETSGPAIEPESQTVGLETSIPSVEPVSAQMMTIQEPTLEDFAANLDNSDVITVDQDDDDDDELGDLVYPDEENADPRITSPEATPVVESAVDDAETNAREPEVVEEIVRRSPAPQPVGIDQETSAGVEDPEQNVSEQSDVPMVEPSVSTASDASTAPTLVGGQSLRPLSLAYSSHIGPFPLHADPYPASLSTPMVWVNGPSTDNSSPVNGHIDTAHVVQDSPSAVQASPVSKEKKDGREQGGEDSDAEGDLDPDYVEVDGVVTPVASTRSGSVPEDIQAFDREPSPVLNRTSSEDAAGHSQRQEEVDSIHQPTVEESQSGKALDDRSEQFDVVSEGTLDRGARAQDTVLQDGTSTISVLPSTHVAETKEKSVVPEDTFSNDETPIASEVLSTTQVAEVTTKPEPDEVVTVNEGEKSAKTESPTPDAPASTQVLEPSKLQSPETVLSDDIVNGERPEAEDSQENPPPAKEVDPMTETDPFKLMGSQSTVAPGAVETGVKDQGDNASSTELLNDLAAPILSTAKSADSKTEPKDDNNSIAPSSSAPERSEVESSTRGSKRKRKSSNPSQSVSPSKKEYTRARKASVATAKGKGKRKQRQESETPSMSSSGASAAAKLLQPSSRASSVASVATGDSFAVTNASPSVMLSLIPPPGYPQLMLHSHSRSRAPPYQSIRPSLSLQTQMHMRGPPTAQSSGSPNSPDVAASPSRSRPVPRAASSPASTRSTRSSCRYRKISLPESDDGPLIHFLVPGCSLVDAELIEDEEIVDIGDATYQDSIRKVDDIETLDIPDYVIAVMRQLVGPDKEQDVYYLPNPGEERARKVRHQKRKSKKFSRESGIPEGSFTSNGTLLSPTSSRAPVSAAGSSSTDASRRKKGNDVDHGTVASYSSGEDDGSDYEEERRGRRPSKKSKPMHPEISELPSGSQSSQPKAPKRGIKRRLGTDAAEYHPGDTDGDTDELTKDEYPKRTKKQGRKRTRTDIQDERQSKKSKIGSVDGESQSQSNPLPVPSPTLDFTDMQWPPPSQIESQSQLPSQ